MLALKLGLSLVSTRPLGAWSPDDESSLVAWYQKGEGITLNIASVSQWADSSSNSYDMVQATALEQPEYSAGVLTFNPGDVSNLQTTGQISITDEFTIGIVLQPIAINTTVLGDNTSAGEFFKVQTSSTLRIKIDNNQVELSLDSGTLIEAQYLVLTRNSSDLLTLYKDGVAQADTETVAGTADIDTIGVRKTDLNPYSGTISEIQIYNSTSADLTANVNDRLAGL
tara:strand:+ start:1002 stop:1679 length:678 start_codon:yes stop_codon:yes gene_type:complete